MSDAGDLASQTNLIKAKMINDIMEATPELGAKREANLVNLEKLSKLEREASPKDFNKVRKERTDQEKAVLERFKAEGIEEGGWSLMPFARPSEEQASMQRRLLRENMVRPGSNLYSQWRENQNIGTSPSLEFITGGKK